MPNHVRLRTISLQFHPEYNESWLQDVIAADPTILGLGNLILRDKERNQVNGGRLDLLLQDPDGRGRYEVEIQLGKTDPSHIIRTIEYWDEEKKRYPLLDHTAVIVAEEINSRFLNVIGLFNGKIPIIAIQLAAIETRDGVGLHFTKVLDCVRLATEEEKPYAPSDRSFWESTKGTAETVRLADALFGIVHEFLPDAAPRYTKHYIGISVDGKPCNFAWFDPQKKMLQLGVHLSQSPEIDDELDGAEITTLDYDKTFGDYRLKLSAGDIEKHRDLLRKLFTIAHKQYTSK